MKRTALRAGMFGGALLAILALAAPALAQAPPDVPPPARFQVDENGVDVARGTLTGTRTDLAIGAQGRAGLSFLRRFGYGQSGHNYDFGLFLSAGQTHAGIGLESIPFTQSGSTYTIADGSGATLVKSGSTYTLTLGDGTIVVYDYGTQDHLDVQRFSRATSITYPSGETATLTWVETTWCSNFYDYCEGGTWLTGVRLQAVSSSMGYQLHFNYGRADVIIPGHATAWRQLGGVTAINTTVETCDPSAHSCSLTNTWPTVAYSAGNVTDPAGRTSTYAAGTLSYTIRRPSAATPNVTYTLTSAYNRFPVTQVVRDGLTWGYNYSVTGNVATMIVTLPGSPTRTRTIVSDLTVGLPTSVTNEVGQTTAYQYDGSGRLTRMTAPEDNYVQLAYDARGNVTTQTAVPKPGTGPTIVTSAAYPASCTNPATCNQPTSTTDARGNVTDYTYDPTNGIPQTVTAPAPAVGAVRPQTRYTYSALTQPSGGSVYRLTQVSQCQTSSSCAGGADEARTTIAYSQANLQPSSVTTASGNGALSATGTIGYDYLARPITADGPLSGSADTVRTRYNLAGQAIGTVSPDPDGAGALKHRAQRITYNSDGQTSRIESGTVNSQSDADWAAFVPLETVDVAYDSSARPVRRTLKGSDSAIYAVADTSYDTAGRPECAAVRMNPAAWGTLTGACAAQSPGSNGPDRISRTTYDAASRPTQVQTGYGTSDVASEVATSYRNNGQVETVTDANGNRTTYVYDGHDRLSQTQYPQPATQYQSNTADYEGLTYESLAGGTRTSGLVVNRRLRDNQNIAFGYDALGRLILRNRPGSELDVTYTYDLLNRMTGASQTGNALSFTFDALSRNLTQTGPRGTVSYLYDLAGRRTRMTYAGSGLYVDYDYLLTGEVTKIRENGAASGVGVLGAYAYDQLGRRNAVTRGNGTIGGYSYDAAGRLSVLADNFPGTASDLTLGFAYNPTGQIASATRSNDSYAWGDHYALNRTYTANGLNRYTAITSGITPTYDGRGNLTSAGTITYSYSSENMLIGVNGTPTLSYDPLLRLYETVGGGVTTRMAYDGQSLIAEYNASNTLLRRYVHGPGVDEPLVWYEGTGTSDRRWLHADERGSIVAVSNGSGAVTNINAYDEYGIPRSTNVGRFQYTGQQWIAELGLYHYRARIYSPTLGRFLQTDPIGFGGGMNLYAYVGNDPANFTDPRGLDEPDGDCEGLRFDADPHSVCVSGPTSFYVDTSSIGTGPGGGVGIGTSGASVIADPRIIGPSPERCRAAVGSATAIAALGAIIFDTPLERFALSEWHRGRTAPLRLGQGHLNRITAYTNRGTTHISRRRHIPRQLYDPIGGRRQLVYFGQEYGEFDALLGSATVIFDADGNAVGLEDSFDFNGGSRYGPATRIGMALIRSGRSESCGTSGDFRITAGVGR